jgi:small-conductance mechanosensitive channel
LLNYGDSSVDFTLLFWVDDVTEGRWGPKSDVMFAIWDKFAANNIEIPFPQRDLHIRSSDTVTGTRLLGNGDNG